MDTKTETKPEAPKKPLPKFGLGELLMLGLLFSLMPEDETKPSPGPAAEKSADKGPEKAPETAPAAPQDGQSTASHKAEDCAKCPIGNDCPDAIMQVRGAAQAKLSEDGRELTIRVMSLGSEKLNAGSVNHGVGAFLDRMQATHKPKDELDLKRMG